MKTARGFVLLIVTLCVSIVGLADQLAAAVLVPAGLGPGSTYHLAFVTAGTTDGFSGDINAYNHFVQAQAELNPFLTGTDVGITWKAVVSTSSVDARQNAAVEGPVFLVTGPKVAEGFADLWDGSLLAPWNVNQFGAVSEGLVLTGTWWTGEKESGLELGGNHERSIGDSRISTPKKNEFPIPAYWTSVEISGPANFVGPVYALSQKLTVAAPVVPEPATWVIWGVLSVVVLGGRYVHIQRARA